jgi:hypothetical protein
VKLDINLTCSICLVSSAPALQFCYPGLLLEALCWLILICPCSICSTPRRLLQNISDSSPSFISFTASWNVRSPRLQSREFPMISSHGYSPESFL